MPIDHALFVGIGLMTATLPAAAQQTPQTYCATLGTNSCEVLNVEVSAVAVWSSGSATGVGAIKYCRDGQFIIAPITTQANPYLNSLGGFSFNFASGSSQVTAGGWNGSTTTVGSVWTNASLCSKLP